MNNFEKACFASCEKWVNSIEETQEPNYSEMHIKKMNTILHGNRRLFNRKTFIVLVACILMLTFSIVAFAYVGSQTKSKDLIFYSQNPIKIGGYESGSSINVRVKGSADYKKTIENLECGYIPEGYREIPHDAYDAKYLWTDVDGNYIYYSREFEKYENGEYVGKIFIDTRVEYNEIHLRNSSIYISEDKTGEELKKDILNNENIETVSPDLYELMERVTDFEENGIHYYFIAPKDEDQIGGELLWDFDGCIYKIECWSLPFEELVKIAKDVR